MQAMMKDLPLDTSALTGVVERVVGNLSRQQTFQHKTVNVPLPSIGIVVPVVQFNPKLQPLV